MAFARASKADIPKGAVILREDEVYEKQKELLDSYQPESEVWFLKYGSVVLGACTAVSGLLMLRHFRAQFLLKHEGRFSSYLPTAMIPALGTQLFHNQIVRQSILLEKNECPICLEMKSASIQVACGVLWPLILAPTASALCATTSKTLYIPLFWKEKYKFCNFMVERFKPGANLFAGLTVFCVAMSCIITFQEGSEYSKFRRRCVLRQELKAME